MTKITIDRAIVDQAIEAAMADQVTHGLGITLGGKRIDPASIYKQAEPATSQESRHVEPVACFIGVKGSAFDLPTTKRAYSYAEQPGDAVAYKLGVACIAAALRSAVDSIDRGLGLLKELQTQGFGVFDIGAESELDGEAPEDTSPQPAQQLEPKLPEFYARFEDGLVSVYQRREDATPLLLLRENLPDKQPAQQEPATLAGHDLDAISEGVAEAQVVYQISMKDGAASSAWVDVDEATYNSAKLYGEFNCRCLYTLPPKGAQTVPSDCADSHHPTR